MKILVLTEEECTLVVISLQSGDASDADMNLARKIEDWPQASKKDLRYIDGPRTAP